MGGSPLLTKVEVSKEARGHEEIESSFPIFPCACNKIALELLFLLAEEVLDPDLQPLPLSNSGLWADSPLSVWQAGRALAKAENPEYPRLGH